MGGSAGCDRDLVAPTLPRARSMAPEPSRPNEPPSTDDRSSLPRRSHLAWETNSAPFRAVRCPSHTPTHAGTNERIAAGELPSLGKDVPVHVTRALHARQSPHLQNRIFASLKAIWPTPIRPHSRTFWHNGTIYRQGSRPRLIRVFTVRSPGPCMPRLDTAAAGFVSWMPHAFPFPLSDRFCTPA
jgi:hypothetical protein